MLSLLSVVLLSGCATAPGVMMVAVPAGTYRIGGEGTERNPPREVTLAAYEIAATETTNAQFARFVAATGYVTDAEREGAGQISEEGMTEWQWRRVEGACWRKPFGDDRLAAAANPVNPVTQISASDAAAYCAWAGGRLPTVEEWEVAARAGAGTRYPWGDELRPGGKSMANIWDGRSHLENERLDGYLYLSPVKSYPPNRWGLYDVIGNVFEYCDGGVVAETPERAGRISAARGGSWWCSAGTCASYNLVDIGQMDRHGSLCNQGFRMARTSK